MSFQLIGSLILSSLAVSLLFLSIIFNKNASSLYRLSDKLIVCFTVTKGWQTEFIVQSSDAQRCSIFIYIFWLGTIDTYLLT